METNKHYLTVGLFVLGGFFATVLFGLWLTSAHEKADYRYYQIRFHESVNGLTGGSPVKYRGVNVGSVMSIHIDYSEKNTILVHIRLLKEAPVKKDTMATLKLQGITGTSYIELSGGESSEKTIEGSKQEDDDLPEIGSKSSDIEKLTNAVPELIDKSTFVATQAGQLIDDEALRHAHAILKRWDTISVLLEKEAKEIDKLVQTTNRVMGEIETARVGETLRNVNEATADLKELSKKANEAAATSLDSFSAFMIDAKKTSKNLRALSQSLNENPSRVLFAPQEKEETLP